MRILTDSQCQQPDDNDGGLRPARRRLKLKREADGVPAVHRDERESQNGYGNGHRLEHSMTSIESINVYKYSRLYSLLQDVQLKSGPLTKP